MFNMSNCKLFFFDRTNCKLIVIKVSNSNFTDYLLADLEKGSRLSMDEVESLPCDEANLGEETSREGESPPLEGEEATIRLASSNHS